MNRQAAIMAMLEGAILQNQRNNYQSRFNENRFESRSPVDEEWEAEVYFPDDEYEILIQGKRVNYHDAWRAYLDGKVIRITYSANKVVHLFHLNQYDRISIDLGKTWRSNTGGPTFSATAIYSVEP